MPRLTITINNQRPIELADLTTSFQGISGEYRDYVLSRGGVLQKDDVRLYVHELKTGSIIAELAPLVTMALPMVEHANQVASSIGQFALHLKSAYHFLLGKKEQSDAVSPELSRQSLQNLSSIVEPVAKDHGSQMNITAGTVMNMPVFNGPVVMNLSHQEANAAQNAVTRRIKEMQEGVGGIHYKVALYLFQARDNVLTSRGDRGIIESISPVHAKLWMDEATKALIMADDPFKYFYIVDVMVETVEGRPMLYKVINYYGKEPKMPQLGE